MCQYCLDLGIDASEPLLWKYNDRQLRIDLSGPTCLHKIKNFLSIAVGDFRVAKFSTSTTEGANDGVDWTIPRRLLKSPRTKSRAMPTGQSGKARSFTTPMEVRRCASVGHQERCNTFYTNVLAIRLVSYLRPRLPLRKGTRVSVSG